MDDRQLRTGDEPAERLEGDARLAVPASPPARAPRVVIALTRRRVLAALWLALFVVGVVVAWENPVVVYESRACGFTLGQTCVTVREIRDPLDMALRSLFAATIVLGGVLGLEWLARNVRFRRA